ncbi:redoxin domain-containing protein [Marinifilum sp. N1E240]|uniref:peroxiredoxin family protein n=1 Tax=Marinifilum sp. N1E240 TaxID=2608082 RepID=UPI00128E7588|nr:thioredoxin fold domain-containing protein [Marinifilum sp. N1E240]MPQ48218.1 redoxin domain-containing protein [Marinifilum sp. N1E240]
MKRTILIITIIAFLVLMLLLTIKKAIDVEKNIPKKELVNLIEIPTFEFKTLNNEMLGNLDLETGKSTIIIHFSPTCDFCDQEAKIIKNYFSEFEKSQVIFTSNHSKKSIKNFQEKHELDAFPNIYFLQYQKNQFQELFGTRKLPSIFIFDTQFGLLKKIDEAISAKTLIKYTRAANDR